MGDLVRQVPFVLGWVFGKWTDDSPAQTSAPRCGDEWTICIVHNHNRNCACHHLSAVQDIGKIVTFRPVDMKGIVEMALTT